MGQARLLPRLHRAEGTKVRGEPHVLVRLGRRLRQEVRPEGGRPRVRLGGRPRVRLDGQLRVRFDGQLARSVLRDAATYVMSYVDCVPAQTPLSPGAEAGELAALAS
ncbi:hypothetical protein JCM4814A_69910 [Streptomyces phaeofaciens JCM 4814]